MVRDRTTGRVGYRNPHPGSAEGRSPDSGLSFGHRFLAWFLNFKPWSVYQGSKPVIQGTRTGQSLGPFKCLRRAVAQTRPEAFVTAGLGPEPQSSLVSAESRSPDSGLSLSHRFLAWFLNFKPWSVDQGSKPVIQGTRTGQSLGPFKCLRRAVAQTQAQASVIVRLGAVP